MKYNPILDVDSYKASHFLQYAPGTEKCFFYVESRGGKFKETVFFGLQYILKTLIENPITIEHVEEAKKFMEAHGEPFPYEEWKYIVSTYNGHLPLKIRAVPEGSVIPTHNVLMTVETTDPKAAFLASWFETALLRVWYPTTVATQSYQIKKLLLDGLRSSGDPTPEESVKFKLHDFGARGVSSRESAGIGGAAHLVNFLGSDTIEGVRVANSYYNTEMAAFSIPAAEHSTITSWGREHEEEAYENMLTKFAKPGSIVAIVSDSYDLFYAIDKIWGESLKEKIISSGATIVIRPDSGQPEEIVSKTILALMDKFGFSINEKGYKVLPSYIRVIQGDGINYESIGRIMYFMYLNKLSVTNIAFGMGGALLQEINRDTQKFAMKLSSITINGVETAVCKNPATDSGKRSKAGKLDLIIDEDTSEYKTVILSEESLKKSVMSTVYENGNLLKDYTLNEVREQVNKTFL